MPVFRLPCLLALVAPVLLPGAVAAPGTAATPGAASPVIATIPAGVDFSDTLQTWDGFGFNYVETAQTRDYDAKPQDYGGFSLLGGEQQEEIVRLVFGPDGLDVDLVKLFLDPWHQREPGGAFDHERTTRHMLRFVEAGVRLAAARGKTLEAITTLYGPPAWATRQGFVGGRDLDPARRGMLADYLIDWARFLRGRGIPVRYLSIHNEGEDFYRWDFERGTQRLEHFDYNLYWPPEQVNAFLTLLAGRIAAAGIEGLGVTNGEPSNWTRFANWGYAEALARDPAARRALALLTTHGFLNGDFSRMSYGTASASAIARLHERRPDLHAWVTSYSWGRMDVAFVQAAHEHIYHAGVNALIPWAGIQHPPSWLGGDPNPGTAIIVRGAGQYEVTPGYFLYRQLTRAGHRGMKVARTFLANPLANLIAFAGAGSGHPDAFVVAGNIGIWKLPLGIRIEGTRHRRFQAYRSTQDGRERWSDLGLWPVVDGRIIYDPPKGSVTTFIGMD